MSTSNITTEPYALITASWIIALAVAHHFQAQIILSLDLTPNQSASDTLQEDLPQKEHTPIQPVDPLQEENRVSLQTGPSPNSDELQTIKAPPKKILLLGASSFRGELGAILTRKLRKYDLEVYRHAKVASGLARPDFYDWFAQASKYVKKYQPDLVILHIVGNDCQSLVNIDKSLHTAYSAPEWPAAYQERMRALLQIFKKAEVEVIVLGMSNVLPTGFRKRLLQSNQLIQGTTTAQQYRFISLWAISSDSNEQPLESILQNGIRYPFFMDDGIHLSSQGAQYVANYIIESLDAQYKWTSSKD